MYVSALTLVLVVVGAFFSGYAYRKRHTDEDAKIEKTKENLDWMTARQKARSTWWDQL